MKAAATVIKWKSDFTYDTLRKGTNRLVCYERPVAARQQPFSVECTSIANLERVAQSLKTETIPDPKERQAAFEAAREGRKVDEARVRIDVLQHDRRRSGYSSFARDDRRAGRHHANARSARDWHSGRRVDHECRHVCCPHHDAGPLDHEVPHRWLSP